MSEHKYFEAMQTTYRVPKDQQVCIAIYAGDAPRKNENGDTVHQLRMPIVLMTENFTNAEETARLIAEILNENAGRFFDSARGPIAVCKTCGSDRVHTAEWVETNTGRLTGDDSPSVDPWCPDCDDQTTIDYRNPKS